MAENTTNTDDQRGTVPKMAWRAIGLLATFSYFFGLGLPFFGPDEPRYSQVAREMFERGDWVTTTLGGFNWFEKPALLYWLEIASFNIFGVNEFAARVGPALFGLGVIISLWTLGRVVESDQLSKHSLGNWLAVIAASTLGIFVFSRGASFDITVTFPLTAAMVSFFVFDRSSRVAGGRTFLPLLVFYIFIGVAVLAKGLIGIVFPFAIVAFYHILVRRVPSRSLLTSLFGGTLLAVVVASTWYLPMYLRNGWEFVDEFFIQHHFQRFTSNKYQHPQPFYFYLWVLPLMTLPWLPFFLAAVYRNVRNMFRNPVLTQPPELPLMNDLVRFCLAWIMVPLVFFSFSGSKLPGYILPAVPGAIVLTTLFVIDWTAKARWRQNAVLVFAGLFFTVLVGLLATVVPKFADSDSVSGLIRAAAKRGYTDERVFGLHAISHSAEFYAAGRLLRDPEGKQKKLYGPSEVATEMQRAGVSRALVLVPVEHLRQLTESTAVKSEIIRDNSELAIVAVTLN